MRSLYTDEIPMSTIPFGDFIELVFKLGVRPDRPDEDESRQMSDGIWDLAERCWDKSPKARPTATQIHDTINIILSDIHDSSNVRTHAEAPRQDSPLMHTPRGHDVGHVQRGNKAQPAVKIPKLNEADIRTVEIVKEAPPQSPGIHTTHSPHSPEIGRMQGVRRVQPQAKGPKLQERDIITVKIITEDTFSRYEGFDLATFDAKHWPPPDHIVFRVSKHETFSYFKAQVLECLGHSERRQSWFRVLINRGNSTFRVDGEYDPEDEPGTTLEHIQNQIAFGDDLRLYFSVNTKAKWSNGYPPPESIIIFLKHFDRARQTLLGCGTVFVQGSDGACGHWVGREEVLEIEDIINEKMGWKKGTALKLYEEITPRVIKPLDPTMAKFEADSIRSGDIICFQKMESVGLENQVGYPDPIQFYEFLENRALVVFRPKFREISHDYPEFSAVLSKKNTYADIAAEASENLQHDPTDLRFTSTHLANGSPKSVLRASLHQNLADIMRPDDMNVTRIMILYEKLG
ncbi:ICP0-binding domain of ubiquitin-specific protease 7-domain-containing protein [Mycena leptocephala]|nr:ICP0-binding domain of ubiquitin-specific protease 7-domain-containing protein [Mycena leptocephala]